METLTKNAFSPKKSKTRRWDLHGLLRRPDTNEWVEVVMYLGLTQEPTVDDLRRATKMAQDWAAHFGWEDNTVRFRTVSHGVVSYGDPISST